MVFLIIGGFLANTLAQYYLRRPQYIKFHGKWYVPAYVVKESKRRRNLDFIILGNSVCNQLFPMHKHRASLASNAGVTVIGNFFLLQNALKRNRLKRVYYFIFPHDLNRSLKHKYTYRQLLLPFLTLESYRTMDSRLQSALQASPLAFLAMVPYFKVTNLIPDIKLRDFNHDQAINPIFINYLQQMELLCKLNQAELRIIALPVPNRFEAVYDTLLPAMQTEIQRANLMRLFQPGFFEEINFTQPEMLKDHVHFKEQYVEQYRKLYQQVIRRDHSTN